MKKNTIATTGLNDVSEGTDVLAGPNMSKTKIASPETLISVQMIAR